MNKVLQRLKIGFQRFILNSIGGGYFCPRALRSAIYRVFGNKIESNNIYPHCYIGGSGLTVRKGVFISIENFFDLSDKIYIGENVHIAMRCTFVTSSHSFGESKRRAGDVTHLPICIGNGCWIGANVTILPGVKIGDGTIIAAGAVVIENCDSNSLYAGVPARKIKILD